MQGEDESERLKPSQPPERSGTIEAAGIANEKNEIKVALHGDRVSVTASVDSQGLQELMNILEAASSLFGQLDRNGAASGSEF